MLISSGEVTLKLKKKCMLSLSSPIGNEMHWFKQIVKVVMSNIGRCV